ncbi:DMT family transporter [Bailinhaonella thermotolerans]|nr:DMT family transporter [Bailinhaonella thermotolerans]
MPGSRLRPGGWLPSFILLSAIWGASFAFIKLAMDAGMAPAWLAFWRCALGAASLILIMAVRREPVPRDPRLWAHTAVVAIMLNTVPFMLIAWAEQHISSVLTGVWNATTPMFTLIFAVALLPDERASRRRLLGLGMGFAGVLVVLGIWEGVRGDALMGSLATLAGTACYGIGFAYTRRYLSGRTESGTVMSAMQIGWAAVQLALIAPVTAGAPAWPGLGPAAAILVLGAVSTGVAYIMNFRLIREAGPTIAATVTYVTPLWSTLIGVVFLSEPVGWNTVAGGVLVIAGVALARTAPSPGPRSPEAPPSRVPAKV